jgi:hypothetical protein
MGVNSFRTIPGELSLPMTGCAALARKCRESQDFESINIWVGTVPFDSFGSKVLESNRNTCHLRDLNSSLLYKCHLAAFNHHGVECGGGVLMVKTKKSEER